MPPVEMFTAHPRSVGESYFAHLRAAMGFGFALLGAGFACLVHGLLPFLCTRTGSDAVARMHDRMVVHRLTGRGRGPKVQPGP